MQTLEALKRKVEIAQDLHSIVRTMKVLAAVNIRQYEHVVKSLADYSQTIELGLQILLQNGIEAFRETPESSARRLGVIILGSDQGMCGRFNEQIVAYALDQITKRGVFLKQCSILAVGMRAVGYLEAARLPIEGYFAVPGAIAGITPLVQEMLVKIEAWHAEQRTDKIFLFYNRLRSGAAYRPFTQLFWPVDADWLQRMREKPWPSKALPAYSMDRDKLFASLIRQHLFVALYRACAESMASENAGRLISMQAAEENIEKRLAHLHLEFHRQRQGVITEELLDIISGFEALTN